MALILYSLKIKTRKRRDYAQTCISLNVSKSYHKPF
jgi:hypothetical protein